MTNTAKKSNAMKSIETFVAVLLNNLVQDGQTCLTGWNETLQRIGSGGFLHRDMF